MTDPKMAQLFPRAWELMPRGGKMEMRKEEG
jgi:hypothetical protein